MILTGGMTDGMKIETDITTEEMKAEGIIMRNMRKEINIIREKDKIWNFSNPPFLGDFFYFPFDKFSIYKMT
jgi:hypothetical protein